MIIIQEKQVMTSWFSSELDPDIYIIVFEKDFINDKIVIEFLKHYIKHSDARSNSEWKLFLINNHESHKILKFIQLANENHILSYFLLTYLTHYMQSLDVSCFQLYKY